MPKQPARRKEAPKRQKPADPARKKRLIRRVILAICIPVTVGICLFSVYRGWARKPAPPPPARPSHQTTQPSGAAPAESDRKEGFYTFLVVGFDKVGANTDTAMVVGCDTANHKVSVMNIPRDTMVNVSWDIKRINSVYAIEGLDSLRDHIGKLIGFLPDYYITIDLKAFGLLVDAIGGVTFNVPFDMYYDDPLQNLHIRQPKGERLLSGDDAMQVVRFRNNNAMTVGYSDIGRIGTQQALLTAIAKQCLQVGNLTKLPTFVEIFNENVESDLPMGSMVWFAEQLLKLDTESDLHFFTMPGNYSAAAYSRTYKTLQSYVTPDPEELLAQINLHLNPYKEPVEAEDLDLMAVDEGGVVSASSGHLADAHANDPRPQTTKPSPSPEPSPEPEFEDEPAREPSSEPEFEDEPAPSTSPETRQEPTGSAPPQPDPPDETPQVLTPPTPGQPSDSPSGDGAVGLLPPMPKPAGP